MEQLPLTAEAAINVLVRRLAPADKAKAGNTAALAVKNCLLLFINNSSSN
jgi:hypothetical protein